MSYLVSLYDDKTGIYDYVLSESKSACKNLEENKKYTDCKVYDCKGFLLDNANRVRIDKVEKYKVYTDGECRDWLADLYVQLKGKSKYILVSCEYTYKTNLKYNNYRVYYNGKKI